LKTYKVKLGYRVMFEAEVEVEAETYMAAMDAAVIATNNAPPQFVETFSTKPAALSVSEKAP
jgi:hypothetical protein